jgi:hypothetical protein
MNYEPGIYQGISHRDYNAIDALRNSYLKKIHKCPAAAKVDDPDDTKALLVGRAAHVITLEGDDAFHSEFVVAPENAPRRPTERQIFAKKPSPETLYAIDFWNSFQAIANGKQIITLDDYQTIRGVRDSVRSHDFAKLLLSEGVSETTVVFEMVVNGQRVRCKVRPDRTPAPSMRVLLDLKTTEDAGYDAFLRSCKKYGYFQQAATYLRGYNTVRDLIMKRNAAGTWEHDRDAEAYPEIDAFAFIAVEKKAPFRCEVYTLGGDSTFLKEGMDQFEEALRIEMTCRERGIWPHYQNAGCQELVPYSEREI